MTSAEYVSELKTLLEAVPALAAVPVHIAWTGDVVAPAIVLVRARVTEESEWTRMGPKRTVTAVIPGSVYTLQPTVQAAADEAATILAAIATAVTPASPDVGAKTRTAQMTEIGWQPYPHDEGGWLIDAEYEITYTADLA